MRFRRLDLNLLVALDALLTCRHVTRAAEQLSVTQSGMSSSLARLREEFDDPLIVRIGRKNMLTPLALSLAEPVRDILLRTERLMSFRPAFNPADSDRQFTIVCTDYVCDVLMSQVIARIAAAAPKVSVVLEDLRDDTVQRFGAGEIEFLVIREELADAAYPREPLFSDNYVCIVWSGNKLVGDTLTLQEYLQLSHVERISEGSITSTWRDSQQSLAVARKIAVQTSPLMVPRMVVGTPHIATIQRRAAAIAAKHLDIRILPLPLRLPALKEVLAWQRHQIDDPAVAWCRGVIRDAAAALDSAA